MIRGCGAVSFETFKLLESAEKFGKRRAKMHPVVKVLGSIRETP